MSRVDLLPRSAPLTIKLSYPGLHLARRPSDLKNLMYQLTPEALLENLNRIAELPTSERSRLRRAREAYRNAKA